MASPIQWTWVCTNSRIRQRTGKPGMLQSMGSQRVGHDWVTELNWRCLKIFYVLDIQITLLFKNFTLVEGTYYMNVTIAQTFLNIIFQNFLEASLCVMQETSERIYWYIKLKHSFPIFRRKTKSLKTILYFKHNKYKL